MCSCKWCLLVLFLSTVSSCWAASDEYYTAGVIEFRPATEASSTELLEENLASYLELINLANGTADILVFPEGTLNNIYHPTAVPSPSQQTLCQLALDVDDEVASFLRQLACAALQAQSYLLLNVKERERCDLDVDCPARGYRLYNTNVVLDRSGAVVSRYRKWNLYLEWQLNRTKTPEYAIFKTDFNVTFGHFVCFDMLFYTPAQELVDRIKVKNVIVSNMFNSEMPFLTANQLQQGWAWANNVNLLVAGASFPQGGISGSGIYAGQQGALVRLMVGNSLVGERQLLLTRVPHTPQLQSDSVLPDIERAGPAQRVLKMLQEPQLKNFYTLEVPLLSGTDQTMRLCQQNLCCSFEIGLQLQDATMQPEYRYRVGTFVGQRRYEEEKYSQIRLCGLFACRNSSVESCGQFSEKPTGTAVEFTKLHVSGEFVQSKRRLLMPSTLSVALYALQATEMNWSISEQSEKGTKTLVELQLKKSHSQLLTFGIYGNYFDEHEQDEIEKEEDEDGGATTAGLSGVLIIGLLLLFIKVE